MFLKRQNKKKKGFTLIELIIVIAIIAILAAIAIPNFLSIQRKARVKADIASAKTIYDATSALIAEGKIVPTTNTVTFTLDNDKVTAEPKNDEDSSELQSYLQTIPKPESIANQNFKVTVKGPESSPIIQVDIGSANVYPVASEDYKLNK
ncbi:prepilin-type N-terminal cleavage/methylation domain-containing protein [Clostridium perfringens]|nr:prepilin-type N-terminal cleavage/methylation domain-containing protein [Clostridium perfringens]MDM0953072.1 prepilin-type N-terminal cleavage/methylation domain-containing protein [Clostridium perfringens]